jgi:hypothetical protein
MTTRFLFSRLLPAAVRPSIGSRLPQAAFHLREFSITVGIILSRTCRSLIGFFCVLTFHLAP